MGDSNLSPGQTHLDVRMEGAVARRKKPFRVIGVDLGTTNSVVGEISWSPDAPPDLCQNLRCLSIRQPTTDGDVLSTIVPSMVAVHPDVGVVVGEGAKKLRSRATELGLVEYENVFAETKNHIGTRRTYPSADDNLRSPKAVAARVLKFLVDSATAVDSNSIDHVVITVPASFQAAHRNDTLEAAKAAGIDVAPGDLLDEPVAAFLDFVARGGTASLQALSGRDIRNLLVFDFGGGTCDIAIFAVGLGAGGLKISPQAVSRYHRLGGGDIDLAILHDCLIPQLQQQNGLGPFDLSYQDKARPLRLTYLSIAESLKVGLSMELRRLESFGKLDDADLTKITKRLPGRYDCILPAAKNVRDEDRVVSLRDPAISAAQLEEILEPFLETDLLYPKGDEYRTSCSMFAPIEDALQRSELTAADIDVCLLVGGSSLLPQVQRAVRAYFGNAAVCPVGDRDETMTAVARGAALQSASLHLGRGSLVTPVAATGISLRTTSGSVEIIPRGQALPFPGDDAWNVIRERIVLPEGSLTSDIALRVEIQDEQEHLLGAWLWRIPPPTQPGDSLDISARMDANQVLWFEVSLRERKEASYSGVIENPLTSVVNASESRERIEQIEERFRRREIKPSEQRDAFVELTNLYREIGFSEKASDLAQHAVKAVKKADPVLLNLAGLAAGEAGDHDREEKFLREAARVSRGWGGPLFNLALSQRRRGHLDDALITIRQARAVDDDPPSQTVEALLLKELGDQEASARVAAAAAQIYGDFRGKADWYIHWNKINAELLSDASLIAEIETEMRRRKSRSPTTMTDGMLPELAPALVRV